jgi:hypothetical protein
MASGFRRPRLLLILSLATLCIGCAVSVKTSPHPTAGYAVLVQRKAQPPERLDISPAGEGCQIFDDRLESVCLIATNIRPGDIGGAALGSLNETDTPAFTALIWRARIDGDATVCDRGGLLSPRLERCRQAAQDPNYVAQGDGLTVSVPLGQ